MRLGVTDAPAGRRSVLQGYAERLEHARGDQTMAGRYLVDDSLASVVEAISEQLKRRGRKSAQGTTIFTKAFLRLLSVDPERPDVEASVPPLAEYFREQYGARFLALVTLGQALQCVSTKEAEQRREQSLHDRIGRAVEVERLIRVHALGSKPSGLRRFITEVPITLPSRGKLGSGVSAESLLTFERWNQETVTRVGAALLDLVMKACPGLLEEKAEGQDKALTITLTSESVEYRPQATGRSRRLRTKAQGDGPGAHAVVNGLRGLPSSLASQGDRH